MKTNAKIKLISIFIVIILITFFLSVFNTQSFYSVYATTTPLDTDTQPQTNTQSNEKNAIPSPTSNEELKIYSDACILIENRTGKTLYEKNSEQIVIFLNKIFSELLLQNKSRNLNNKNFEFENNENKTDTNVSSILKKIGKKNRKVINHFPRIEVRRKNNSPLTIKWSTLLS